MLEKELFGEMFGTMKKFLLYMELQILKYEKFMKSKKRISRPSADNKCQDQLSAALK